MAEALRCNWSLLNRFELLVEYFTPILSWNNLYETKGLYCSYGGGGTRLGEVTCGGSPQLSFKRYQFKSIDFGQAGYLTYLG